MKGTMADRHYANRHNSARLRGWADENHLPFSSQNAIFYNNTIDLIWFLNAVYFYFKHMYWKIITSGSMSNHFFCQKILWLQAFQAQTWKKDLSRPFYSNRWMKRIYCVKGYPFQSQKWLYIHQCLFIHPAVFFTFILHPFCNY